MSLHLTREGSWRHCELEVCQLPYHVPDMPIEEAERLPEGFLDQLFGAGEHMSEGLWEGSPARWWHDDDSNAVLHRDFDRPAVIFANGERLWYRHGQLHRGHDRPARIYANGTQFWYYEGQLHRERGPAMVAPDGTQLWYQHGLHHRDEDDEPAAIYGHGTLEWWHEGKLHRESGPARIVPGERMEWYQKGQLHGFGKYPAVVYADARVEYWEWGQRQAGPSIYDSFDHIDREFEEAALARDRARGYRS